MNNNDPILDWQVNDNYARRHGITACMSALGYIPTFVTEADPRPAWEQFNENYVFGGWNPMAPSGWRLDQNDYLHYPGDPAMEPIATARLRDERILVYPYSFVCIVQRDGSFSVARMD